MEKGLDAQKAGKSDKLPLESEEEETSSQEDATAAMNIDLPDQQPVASEEEESPSGEHKTSGEEDSTDAAENDPPDNNKASTSTCSNLPPVTSQTTSSPTTKSTKMEAMEIIKHGEITSSGMSSSEASNLLSAFLSLGQNERKAVLSLSHDDMVAEFENIAKASKAKLKHREVYYTTSPKRKRLCRRI
jgi:hypothetical protein